jgi:uncharacterized protein (DUF983 family)
MSPRPGSPRPLAHGLKRGVQGRCPNCGEGRLFRGYLKVNPTCEACGHENGRYPADDGPAYFTILLAGHLFVAPLLIFSFMQTMNPWLLCAVILPPLAIATLILLRVTKGGLIGVLWSTRAGSAQ